jgi:gamma-polyglutamate biosynthesis protein CapA
VVIGHHPHTLQGVERYNGKLIFYSVGNFLFTSPTPKTNNTIIVELTLAKNGVTDHSIVPVRIDGVRPRTADENESRRIMTGLEKLSQGLTELAADKALPLIK